MVSEYLSSSYPIKTNSMVQRNVSQQNDATLAEIERAAAMATQEPYVRWLTHILSNQGMSPRDGILVRVRSAPDQFADVYNGLWLTKNRRFKDFTIGVSRVDDSLEIEHFRDITDEMVVSKHALGTGKTFGYLAFEVLENFTG